MRAVGVDNHVYEYSFFMMLELKTFLPRCDTLRLKKMIKIDFDLCVHDAFMYYAQMIKIDFDDFDLCVHDAFMYYAQMIKIDFDDFDLCVMIHLCIMRRLSRLTLTCVCMTHLCITRIVASCTAHIPFST